MRKLHSLSVVAALGFMSGVSAQQLPNVGFEDWKATCGSTEALGDGGYSASPVTGEMRVRPGSEPEGWNGSSVNQKVFLEVKTPLVERADEGDAKARLFNEFVGMAGIGSVAPGFLTLGTPWVYASTDINNCDGGVYGGVKFTSTPDAIAGDFRRTDTNDENSHFIAYIWAGTFKSLIGPKNNPGQVRDDVTAAVMGNAAEDIVSQKGTLIAKADLSFKSTDGEWKTFVTPIDYLVDDVTPEKANVIVSSGDFWDRGALVKGTTLLADNVRFVYYSRIASVAYARLGEEGEVIELDDVTFDENGLTEVELPFEFEHLGYVETLGRGVTPPDLCNSTYATTREDGGIDYRVVVNNPQGEDIDGLSTHTYILHFAAPEVKSTNYDGYLTIVMGSEPITVDQAATITITPTGDNTCTFVLPDFALDLGSGPTPLGDIVVPDVHIEPIAGGNRYTGTVKGMELLDGELVADVSLSGIITDEGAVNMDIEVLWMDIPIKVTFSSSMGGVNVVNASDDRSSLEYYNLNGVRLNAPDLRAGDIVIVRTAGKAYKTVIR